MSTFSGADQNKEPSYIEHKPEIRRLAKELNEKIILVKEQLLNLDREVNKLNETVIGDISTINQDEEDISNYITEQKESSKCINQSMLNLFKQNTNNKITSLNNKLSLTESKPILNVRKTAGDSIALLCEINRKFEKSRKDGWKTEITDNDDKAMKEYYNNISNRNPTIFDDKKEIVIKELLLITDEEKKDKNKPTLTFNEFKNAIEEDRKEVEKFIRPFLN